MSDWPTSYAYQVMAAGLSTADIAGPAGELALFSGQTWVTSTVCVALRVLYIPVQVAVPVVVTGMSWYNGAYSTPANIDCGITDIEGTLQCNTGSTAQSGASAIQTVNAGTGSMVNTALAPGTYYLAIEADSTNGYLGMTSGGAAAMWRVCGCRQATTIALGIPASAPTWAVYSSYAKAPLIVANITAVGI